MEEQFEHLKKIGNRTPFKEPENYFEQLPSIIDAKVTPKKVSFFEKTKPLLYFAAIFVGFYVVIHFAVRTLNNNPEQTTLTAQQEKTSDDVLYNYVLSELDENTIVDYLLAEK